MNSQGDNSRLSQGELLLFQELLLRRTGMHITSRRSQEMGRHLWRVAAQEGMANLQVLYEKLDETRTESELWDQVISGLTIGETYFFRDRSQFEALRFHLLPEIIKRRGGERRLRLWSAGCASGEEPYSLAMLLTDIIPDIDRWSISILGTDINKDSLGRARRGRYKKWSFRQVGPDLVRRFFTQDEDRFDLHPRIKSMVSFNYLNLSEDNYPSLMTNTCAMDLILCRNVAIYLPDEQVQAMVRRFGGCLSQGGWLMVAATETDPRGFPGFVTRNMGPAAVYQVRGAEDEEPQAPWDLEACSAPEEPEPAVTQFKAPQQRPAAPPAWRPPLVAGPDVLSQARHMMETDRYQSARCLLEQATGRQRAAASLWLKGARRLANLGKLAEARYWCEKSLKAEPLSAEAHHCRALIALEEGEPLLAGEHLRNALYLEPNHLAAHFSLATLYRRLGQSQKAQVHGRQAIRLASSLPPEQSVPEADGLAAGRIVTMLRVLMDAA
ncbi:MAG: hypothetical protein KKC30_07475 [Proteobacteria bacterium]|nr:hypothetical protein [Pseudomonadota bacterium]MCG2765827.1 hypothetical protein [Desulfarculaceae bacterium]